MLAEFIMYLQQQVANGSIYVLGAQGQTGSQITESWIKTREHNKSSNYNRAIKLWKSRKDKYPNLRAFDCSGLGMYFIQNQERIYKSDLTANGMMKKCEIISKDKAKRGDWVFKVNSSGAYHIGYIVDTDLNVIESRGRDYGVVQRPFADGKWDKIGRPTWFKKEIEEQDEPTPKYIFTRILKKKSPMMSGEDVKWLQMLLNEKHGAGLAEDGKFGKKTDKAVRSYQKAKGLKVDGKAGRNTITALGGTYA